MTSELDAQIQKAINETEAEVLSAFEKIVFRPSGVNRQTSLIVWVCLWLLLLHYKWCMPRVTAIWRDQPFSMPSQKFKHESENANQLE